MLERLVHIRLNPRLYLVLLRTIARRDPQRLLEVRTNGLRRKEVSHMSVCKKGDTQIMIAKNGAYLC